MEAGMAGAVNESVLQEFLKGGTSRTRINFPSEDQLKFSLEVQCQPDGFDFNPKVCHLSEDDECDMNPRYIVTHNHADGTTTFYLKSDGQFVYQGADPRISLEVLIEDFRGKALQARTQIIHDIIVGPSAGETLANGAEYPIPQGILRDNSLQDKLAQFFEQKDVQLEVKDLESLMNVFLVSSQLAELYRLRMNTEKRLGGHQWHDRDHQVQALRLEKGKDIDSELKLSLETELINKVVNEGFVGITGEELSKMLKASPLEWAHINNLVGRHIMFSTDLESPWNSLPERPTESGQ